MHFTLFLFQTFFWNYFISKTDWYCFRKWLKLWTDLFTMSRQKKTICPGKNNLSGFESGQNISPRTNIVSATCRITVTVCPTSLAPVPRFGTLSHNRETLSPKTLHPTNRAFQNIRPFVTIFNVDITRLHLSQRVQRGSWRRHDRCHDTDCEGRWRWSGLKWHDTAGEVSPRTVKGWLGVHDAGVLVSTRVSKPHHSRYPSGIDPRCRICPPSVVLPEFIMILDVYYALLSMNRHQHATSSNTLLHASFLTLVD